MAKLSVAFVTPGAPILGFIFGFNLLTDIAKVLRNRGCEIYFIQPEGPEEVGVEKSFSQITFKEAKLLHLVFMPIKKVSSSLFTALTSVLNYELYSTLLRLSNKTNVIICDNVNYFFPTMLAAKLAKKPLILLFGNILFMKHSRRASKQPKVNLLLLYSLLAVEKMFASLANKVVALSKNDETVVNSWGIDQSKIETIPLSINLKRVEESLIESGHTEEEFSRLEALKAKGTRIIVFHGGLLSDYPNEFACRYIVNELVPYISKRCSDVFFLVIGPYPPDDLIGKSDKVIFTGFVPPSRIFSYISLADVAIAPIVSGSGPRTKILEYFALSKPVITTPLGVEGLTVKDMVHCSVVKNLDNFPERLVSILEDRDFASEMGRKARKYVEKERSLSNYERYFSLIGEISCTRADR